MENKPKPVQKPGSKEPKIESNWTKPLFDNEQLRKLLRKIEDEQKDK